MFVLLMLPDTLHEKCSYTEVFWSIFSRIRIQYGVSLRIQLYAENNEPEKLRIRALFKQ